MWKLQIVDEEGQRSEVALDRDEVTIGRKENNTIRLPEQNVSRQHARLVRDKSDLLIEDMGSSFGTRVNGAKLTARKTLSPGDEVRIGDYHLLVWYDGDTDISSIPQLDTDGVYQLGRARLVPQEHRCRLAITDGRLAGAEFTLDRTPMTLGRADDASIRLDEPGVGAEDAVFTYEGGTYFVAESGKYARVKVRGEVVQSAALRPGDTLEIGGVAFRLLGPDEEWVPPVASLGQVSPSAEEEPASRGRGGALAAGFLFLLAAAAVGLYFLYYVQPNPVADSAITSVPPNSRVSGRAGETAPTAVSEATPVAAGEVTPAVKQDPAAGAVADVPTQRPGAAGEATADPPKPDTTPPDTEGHQVAAGAQPTQAQAVAPTNSKAEFERIYEEANGIFSERRWDAAIERFDAALLLQPTNTTVRARRDQAAAERSRAETLALARHALEGGRLEKAWDQVKEQNIPTSSVYASDFEALRSEVGASYQESLLSDAKKVLDRDPQRALDLARLAQKLPGTSKELRPTLREAARALERLKATRTDGSQTAEPPSRASGEGQESRVEKAKTLYMEGRTFAMKGNKEKALELFKQAADQGGYAPPHKQLGIIFAERGDVDKALKHYRTYLKLNPNAVDAEQVRYSIERLTQQR